jgi:sugar (pentulose or hexulose) kinase
VIDCLATLDAGTGSGRCVVYDAAGQPLAGAREPFHYRLVENPDFPYVRGFDLDPVALWGALAGCARRALAALPSDARIRGVIATSQREACVFLDRDDTVLYAGPNLDARAALEGMEVQHEIGAQRLHAITGHMPPYVFAVARWLWYRKRHDVRRVATLFMLNDWITHRLSGARLAERSNAGESMLFDVRRGCWSSEMLETFAIPADVLPELRPAGSPAGGVTARAAAETGLPAGTPVFVGGPDTESALLGSGAVDPGETAAVLGTTCPVQQVLAEPLLDPAANLWTSCHVVPGRWVLESNAGDTGGAYRWLLELLLGAADTAAHARAEAEMATGGRRRVLAYLGPVVFNLAKMSPFRPAGVLFPFPLLHTDRPTRGELLHGFLESVAFAVRANCEQIRDVSGVPVSTLRASGGLVQSPTLVGLLADTLGAPVAVATVPESASLGSAILAAVGAGLHPDVGTAVAGMTASREVAPDAARAVECDARYRKWREVYDLLLPVTL